MDVCVEFPFVKAFTFCWTGQVSTTLCELRVRESSWVTLNSKFCIRNGNGGQDVTCQRATWRLYKGCNRNLGAKAKQEEAGCGRLDQSLRERWRMRRHTNAKQVWVTCAYWSCKCIRRRIFVCSEFVHVCEIHLKFYTDCFTNNSISESEMDSSEERQFSCHSWKWWKGFLFFYELHSGFARVPFEADILPK